MNPESSRVTDERVGEVVAQLNGLAVQSHDAGDRVLWMVFHCAAESIADAVEQRAEWQADDE